MSCRTSSSRAVRALLAVALLSFGTGCSHRADGTSKVTPTAVSSQGTIPAASPCRSHPTPNREFEVELDVMSGRPNPRVQLTAAESKEFRRRILAGGTRIVAADAGPGRLGYRGYVVRAAASQQSFLRQASLGREFRIVRKNPDVIPPGSTEAFLAQVFACTPGLTPTQGGSAGSTSR